MRRPDILGLDMPRSPLFSGRTGLIAAVRKHVKLLSGQVAYDPRVVNLSNQLLTLGFTEPPLRELEDLAHTSWDRHCRTSACLELAKWYMRNHAQQSYSNALKWVQAGKSRLNTRRQRQHLYFLEVLCHSFLDDFEAAHRSYEEARQTGNWTADLGLAGANFAPDGDTRIGYLNSTLQAYDIPVLGLGEDDGRSVYDRLICATPLSQISGGPKVTVILAVYEADETLLTALEALQSQTWQNLEILIVDDASPSRSTGRIAKPFVDSDTRFRLIELTQNGGAYVARNHALDHATGEFVTLHDADDWSHPQKIETQVRFMQANKTVLGCTSEQARATNEMQFMRWTAQGRFVMTNISSFMFRRAEMREHFGYWDTVRLSADNELIRRMRAKFRFRAVKFIRTGPLAFQRFAENTMTSDPILGINGYHYGARQEYLEAQGLRHRRKSDLRYSGRIENRPFPAPAIMQPDRVEIAQNHNAFDVIIASDFRTRHVEARSALRDIKAYCASGLRVAIFPLYRYLGAARYLHRLEMLKSIRQEIWDSGARILSYGEVVKCKTLLIHGPSCILHPQRYLPVISSEDVGLVVRRLTAAPISASDVVAALDTARSSFGDRPLTLHPYDPDARTHLKHILASVSPLPLVAEWDWCDARPDLDQQASADQLTIRSQ